MRITVLAGGFGGSRFITGVRDAMAPDDELTVIANTADDIWLFGLRVSPDLDTIMYTLGGGIDPERGWGRTDETWHAKEELAAYGEPQAWFGLGDRDLATHLVRTARLRVGRTLTEATAELCRRWDIGVTLLPMTDAEVETHIATTIDGRDDVIHFQEYWIRHRRRRPGAWGRAARHRRVASHARGALGDRARRTSSWWRPRTRSSRSGPSSRCRGCSRP